MPRSLALAIILATFAALSGAAQTRTALHLPANSADSCLTEMARL